MIIMIIIMNKICKTKKRPELKALGRLTVFAQVLKRFCGVKSIWLRNFFIFSLRYPFPIFKNVCHYHLLVIFLEKIGEITGIKT